MHCGRIPSRRNPRWRLCFRGPFICVGRRLCCTQNAPCQRVRTTKDTESVAVSFHLLRNIRRCLFVFLCVPFILRPCKTYRDLMREGMSPVRYVSGTSFRLWFFHQFVQFVDHSFCETRPPVKSREHPICPPLRDCRGSRHIKRRVFFVMKKSHL